MHTSYVYEGKVEEEKIICPQAYIHRYLVFSAYGSYANDSYALNHMQILLVKLFDVFI